MLLRPLICEIYVKIMSKTRDIAPLFRKITEISVQNTHNPPLFGIWGAKVHKNMRVRPLNCGGVCFCKILLLDCLLE